MPTRTVLIAPVDCRVRFATQSGQRSYVTAESFSAKTAFRFEDTSIPLLREGEHVRISGSVEVDIVSRDPEVLKRTDYRHEPLDGSSISEWEYFHGVTVSSVERIGPPDLMDALRKASAALDRHVHDWAGNRDIETLAETIKIVFEARSKLLSLFVEKYEERRSRDAVPVKTAKVESI
jgi:hypothetical protein